MEFTIVFVALAALIALAATAPRFGADSRESLRSEEHELALRGLAWDAPAVPGERSFTRAGH